MTGITDSYSQLCKKYNIEIQECVQEALMRGEALDLSNQTLDVGTCAVLGKMMQVSGEISKASFEDCLLKEDGVKSILLGLCGNSSVKTLVLKGNCMQGGSTTALAKMLRHNSTITRLSLEWNNLGLHAESFNSFCEALGSNTTLQHLDLRSNQLGVDAAASLAKALARNSSLSSLDLRWNNVGVVGGKALLESLSYNRTLTLVNLVGNNVPNDIMSAIDNQIAQHSHSALKEREYTSQTSILKQQLEMHEQHSTHQIKQLENSLAQKELALNRTLQEGEFNAGKLEEQLRTKVLELEALKAKYELIRSALHLSQERVSTLEKRNQSLEEELNVNQEELLLAKKTSKETLDTTRSQHNQEVRTLTNTITQLETKVGELTFQCEEHKKEIFDLKEIKCSLQATVKGLRVECEEAQSREHRKHKQAVESIHQQHTAEVHQLRNDHQQAETEMREKLATCETLRSEAQVETANLQLKLSAERSSTQAQLLSLRQQLKAEQATVTRGLEDQLRAVEESRNEAEERLRGQVAANSTLRASNTKLTAHIHTLNNEITELQTKVESREEEVKAAEKRIREEFESQLEELQQERNRIVKLDNTILELKRTINDLEHKCALQKREINHKEEELEKVHEDEAHRAAVLHSAFMSYFNSSPGSPTKPK